MAQDAIYVGGGSMRNMLAIWREHGIEEAMRRAWHRGIVLAGLSAGAMCWFAGGISMSGGAPEPVNGLGLLEGSLSVHLDGEAERWPVYQAAVASRVLPPGYAADDGAALLFAGVRLRECVASRPGARVMRVKPDGAGGVIETQCTCARLPGVSSHSALDDDRSATASPNSRAAGRPPPLGLTVHAGGGPAGSVVAFRRASRDQVMIASPKTPR